MANKRIRKKWRRYGRVRRKNGRFRDVFTYKALRAFADPVVRFVDYPARLVEALHKLCERGEL